MKEIEDFEPVSLECLESLDLLSRFDSKFLVNRYLLPQILQALMSQYRILEIGGNRIFTYANQYFDTKDYKFYTDHHNGKHNRSKVRYRQYEETDVCNFEIKSKSNSSETSKERLKSGHIEQTIIGDAAELISEKLHMDADTLYPKLKVFYKRITLINPELPEKITIDTDIRFFNTIKGCDLPDVALIEIKQKRVCHCTPSMMVLRSLNIHQLSGLSKYCMGLALTDSTVKYNRFKPKVLSIQKFSRN